MSLVMRNTNKTIDLDKLTAACTAWDTFAALCSACDTGYVPTIRVQALVDALRSAGYRAYSPR